MCGDKLERFKREAAAVQTESEYYNAIALAHRVLDRPNADPDDDLAILARQFIRATERATKYRDDWAALQRQINRQQ